MGNLDLNKNWRKFEPESTKLFFKVVIKKGVFAKNERGYRVNAIKKRF